MDACELLTVSRGLFGDSLRRMSDAELVCTVRSGLDIMFLLSCGIIGDEADDAALRDTLLRRVYPSLQRRYARSAQPADKWRLLDARFRTLYYAAPFYDRREARCYDDLSDFLSLFSADALRNLRGDDLYAVLQAILRWQYGFSSTEPLGASGSALTTFLTDTLDAWTASLTADGSWSGLGAADALQRLAVLDMAASMLLDERFAQPLPRALAHYCTVPPAAPMSPALPATPAASPALPLTDDEVRHYARMYDLLYLTSRLPQADIARRLDAIVALLSTRPDAPRARAVILSRTCRILAREADCGLAVEGRV